MLSRGTHGYLAVTTQQESATQGKKITIGIAALPAESGSCWNKTAECGFNWLPSSVLPGQNKYVADASMNFGFRPLNFPKIAHLGDGGEESNRILLGYAAGVDYGRATDGYYLQETDWTGKLYGTALKLDNPETGWGEVDPWTTMANGCVAWPFAWHSKVGDKYSEGWALGKAGKLSNVIRITVACPPGDRGEFMLVLVSVFDSPLLFRFMHCQLWPNATSNKRTW